MSSRIAVTFAATLSLLSVSAVAAHANQTSQVAHGRQLHASAHLNLHNRRLDLHGQNLNSQRNNVKHPCDSFNPISKTFDLTQRNGLATVHGAQPAHFTGQELDSSRLIHLNKGIDLDLSTSERNITLGGNLIGNGNSVTIASGSGNKTVSAGSRVTPAEYVAIKQILSGFSQTLIVDSDGRATGGAVNLEAITSANDRMRASSLVVPTSVTALGNFGKSSEFRLTGDLINSGSVLAYSTSQKNKGGVISANNVMNNEGALISTVLDQDTSRRSGNVHSAIDLTLKVAGDLINYGTISSSGDLTFSVLGTLTNSGDRGSIAARRNVSLQSSQIVNSGRIESERGNVSMDASSLSTLSVNNTGGTINASNGSIDIRSPEYSGTFDTTIGGGNLLSEQLNLNAGSGLMTVNVGELTGAINQTGSAAHLTASTADMQIGHVCLEGDPTFFNTAGNITIAADVAVGEALTIIASGNITVGNGVTISAGDVTRGFPITLIAGANISATSGGANQASLGPIPPTNVNNGGATIDGASASGGSIDLQSGTIVSEATDAVGINFGGSVLLAAFANGAAAGKVLTGSGTITTNGRATGSNGDLTIIAGGTGVPILVGTYNSNLGFNGGDLNITAAQPFLPAGTMSFLANGSVSGGSIGANAVLTPAASIQFADNVNVKGSVTASTSLNMTTAASKLLKAPTITLNADAVKGILAGTRFTLDATTLKGTVTTSLLVDDPNNITFGVGQSGIQSPIINIQAAGQVTISGGGTPGTISDTIIATATTGNLNVLQSLQAAVVIDLDAGANINSVGNNVVQAPKIWLAAAGTIGSAAERFEVDSSNFSYGAGDIFLFAPNNLTFGNFAFNIGALLDVFTPGDINVVAGCGMFNGNTNLVSTGGAIDIAGNLQGGANLDLHANTTLTTSGAAAINGQNVHLTTDVGNIGLDSLFPFQVDAVNLTVTATGSSAFVKDINNVTIVGGTTAAAALNFSAAGNISTAGPGTISAPFVQLNSLAGSVDIGCDVGGGTTILAALTNITSSGAGRAVGPLVALFTFNGNIGTSPASRFNLDTDALAVHSGDSVFISDSDDLTFSNLNGPISSDNTFDVLAGTGLTANFNITTTTGSMVLASAKGTVRVNSATVLTANEGDLTLQVTDTSKTAKKTSKIIFDAGATVQALAATAGLGNLFISIGTPGAPLAGKAPKKNITQNITLPGQIFFGKKSISAKLAPNNILTAKVSNITFNNPLSAKNIVLNGGVILTADPPSAPETKDTQASPTGLVHEADKLLSQTQLVQNANADNQESLSKIAPIGTLGLAGILPAISLFGTASSALNLVTAEQQTLALGDSRYIEDDSCITVYGAGNQAIDAKVFSDLPQQLDSNQTLNTVLAPTVENQSRVSVAAGDNHLFITTRDLSVETPHAVVRISSDSVVLIASTRTSTSIFNLHDQKRGSVKIEAQGRVLGLTPGRHITLAKSRSKHFSEVNSIENILHRDLNAIELTHDTQAYESEFFLPSAIESIAPLKRLMAKSDSQTRKLADRIAKTAAILTYLGNSRPNSFQQYSAPRITALKW